MRDRPVEVGGGWWRLVKVVGLVGVSGGLLATAGPPLTSTVLHPPPPTDVHAEYVKFPSGRDTITAYLAYPERKDPAPVVVVIHEIFGMSDFLRQTTEQLAKDGFVAIAPDLLSRRGGTPPSPDDARKLIAGLEPDTVTKDLDATVAYVKRIKAGLADVDAAIRTYHKTYRYTVYPGVGHGFLRAREKPEVADSAWKAVVGFFRESLEH